LIGRLENSSRSAGGRPKADVLVDDTLKVTERRERESEGVGREHHERSG